MNFQMKNKVYMKIKKKLNNIKRKKFYFYFVIIYNILF